MYIPPDFDIKDRSKLVAIIEQFSFATLVTSSPAGPMVSHLPILIDPSVEPNGQLIGHMARANPQWQAFDCPERTDASVPVLAIFHGPHAYISPNLYATDQAVPTWNYVVVHAYGCAKSFDDTERLESILRQTITKYESSKKGWNPKNLPHELFAKLLESIVGFEIEIDRLEGKFKLGQNRSSEDLAGVYQALSNSNDTHHQELARIMAEQNLA